MATATKKATFQGFGVVCPACGDEEARISLDVNRLEELHCSNCDWEGSPQEALAMAEEKAKQWRKLVRWIEAAGELADDDNAV
jgi:hypothetical protein